MAGIPGQRTTKRVAAPRGYKSNTLSELDCRYRPAREIKARWNQLAADLGGVGELSYQRQSLLWRFTFLESWIEGQERRMLQGEGVDESKWLASLSTYASLLSRIGLERKARQISPLERLRMGPEPLNPALPPRSGQIAQPGLNTTKEQALPSDILEVFSDPAS